MQTSITAQKILYEKLKTITDNVFIMYTTNELSKVRKQLPDDNLLGLE